MKKLSLILICSLIISLTTACAEENLGISNNGRVSKAEPLAIHSLVQIDAWPEYQAKQDKFDEKNNFKLAPTYYSTGTDIYAQLQKADWQIASLGVSPAMMVLNTKKAELIGIASDESAANIIFARPNDPILTTTEPNGIRGAKELVQSKTFILTTASTSSVLLHHYLQQFNLSEKDISIQAMEPDEAIKAYKSGKGDYLILWSPYIYKAFDQGWQEVVNGKDLDLHIPMLYVANAKWAKENPDKLKAFLKIRDSYIQQLDATSEESTSSLKQFFKTELKVTLSDQQMSDLIKRHQLFTTDQQNKLISNGDLKEWMVDNANIYSIQGKFSKQALDNLSKSNFYITGDYLN